MHHLEARTGQQVAKAVRCQRPNRLTSCRRQPSHSGLADVGDCRDRGDHQLPARAEDGSKLLQCASLIAVPVERLRADDDVSRRRPERQELRIGTHEVCSIPDSIARFAEHPGRVVDADDLSIRELLRQPPGELAGAASEIQHHLGLRPRETSQHRIVNWSIRRSLKAGPVVDGRPPIEQPRSLVCHGPVSHRSVAGGSSCPMPTA